MNTPFDLTQTDKLLSTTRAVRKRLDFTRPVADELLLDCVRLSQQAPTGSNTQTWRWVIVTDREKKQAIADIYARGTTLIAEAGAQVVEEGDKQTGRVYDSAGYLVSHLHEVPALVFPCVVGRPAQGASQFEVASAFGSILPAVWSFQLALRSRGLGSAWTTMHLFWESDVAEILGIPEHVMQVAMIPVAYTKGTEFKQAVRQPPEEITHFNGWNE